MDWFNYNRYKPIVCTTDFRIRLCALNCKTCYTTRQAPYGSVNMKSLFISFLFGGCLLPIQSITKCINGNAITVLKETVGCPYKSENGGKPILVVDTSAVSGGVWFSQDKSKLKDGYLRRSKKHFLGKYIVGTWKQQREVNNWCTADFKETTK